jgi:flagellar biosynthesis/type III secretory pathway chaperone
MIELLKNLVSSLREELQQYGEMLALLDQQQELVVSRATDELFQTVFAIQSQAGLLQRTRQERERCRQALAQHCQMPESTAFADLMPRLLPDYQPQLEALVQENNELLMRVQQRARQNQLLLSRSVELMQQFIGSLLPSRQTVVYTGQGDKCQYALPNPPLYEAVG